MNWLREAKLKWPARTFKLGQVTNGRTSDKGDEYFKAIRNARIVVTAGE